MLCFIPKMIEFIGTMPPFLISFLIQHGQTSASARRTLHFHAMNLPITIFSANLASTS